MTAGTELYKKKFSILQEIATAIVVTDNLSAIANLMLDLAINYTNAEKGSLMLVNEMSELNILAARGIDLDLLRNYRLKVGEGIAGTVAKNLTSVLVEDIDQDERFKGKHRDRYKTKSFISCPIVSRNKLLGVFNINDKKDGSSFNEDEFSLLKIIANQAAITLENAILLKKVRDKAAETEEINRKLMEMDAVKTEFLTRVSHELRTPLNSVKGAIFYLQQTETLSKESQKEFYDIINIEVNKLVSIVENQLDFLRLEDEARIINKTVINLLDILNEFNDSRLIKTLQLRHGITLTTAIDGNLSDIVGDRIRVAQFFMNIIEGLCSFAKKGDTLRIEAKDNHVVQVKITLPRRLPESILPFLFNSSHLFQTEQSDEKLKLYLARKVAELHNWDLIAENNGNSFTLSLNIPKSAKQKVEAVMSTTIDMFLDFISELLQLNTCSIMLCDEITGDLTIKTSKGIDSDLVKRTRIGVGEKIAGWVAMEGKPLYIEDIESDARFSRKSTPQYNAKSLISLPLKIRDKVIGVLNLNNKKSADPLTMQDFHIASQLSERVAYFIERLYSGDNREEDFKYFISSFDTLIDAGKKYQKKSCLLPLLLSKIMDSLGCDEEEKKVALYVSMVYDLGLMLVDETIKKKKQLLPAEISSLRVHPFTTVGLINSFEFSEDVKLAILHHHERFDGTGYPDNRKGEEIPLISRVLAVVDAFCAMLEKRPYRNAMTEAETLEEIKRNAGTMYDPRIVEVLEQVILQGNA